MMEVIEWDVIDGGLLGAVIRCPACPCRWGTGCDGTMRLHRPYRYPSGAFLDLHGPDATLHFAASCTPPTHHPDVGEYDGI